MMFQGNGGDPILFLVGLIVGTIVIGLILYLATMLIISSRKARDKVVLIFIEALIAVLVLPLIIGAIAQVLGAIGEALASVRNAIDGGGAAGYLLQLAIIFGFLILLAMTKFFLDTTWESALWISIIVLFVLYCLLTVFPELYEFLNIGV
jgi:hypothetical protein